MSMNHTLNLWIGADVLWYADGDMGCTPSAGKVTRLNIDNVTLAIADPENHNLGVRDGVRYVFDKKIKDMEKRDCGCWDYTPAHKELLDKGILSNHAKAAEMKETEARKKQKEKKEPVAV